MYYSLNVAISENLSTFRVGKYVMLKNIYVCGILYPVHVLSVPIPISERI